MIWSDRYQSYPQYWDLISTGKKLFILLELQWIIPSSNPSPTLYNKLIEIGGDMGEVSQAESNFKWPF